MTHDRIEKQVLLNARIARAWDAISDSAKFGTWFGMRVDGPFVQGTMVSGHITETQVDEDIAAKQRPHVGAPVTLWIVAVEPPRRLAFRWNPLPDTQFAELTTLVEFTLTDRDGATVLTIVESGFDALPDEHRTTTFQGNSHGWELQAQLINTYLTHEFTV